MRSPVRGSLHSGRCKALGLAPTQHGAVGHGEKSHRLNLLPLVAQAARGDATQGQDLLDLHDHMALFP